jgi:hypothetical protein
MESGFYEGHEEDFEGLRKAIWEASKDREEAAEGGSSEDKSKTDEKGKEEEDTSEDDVQKIEQMMARLRAAREMGEGMPEDQRRRIAAKAVAEAMRDL